MTAWDDDNRRSLGLITAQVHAHAKGHYVTTSHGQPPRGFYASLESAREGADRHMRAQLERTLSLLTLAEDEPGGSKPRPCGVVLLYPTDDPAVVRKAVLAALLEVS